MKKQLLALAALTTLLSSCLGPKMINKWTENKYGEGLHTEPKFKSDYLSVTSGLVTADTKASETTKKTVNFLPLLVYWQYDYRNTCTLNPKIPVNNFRSTVLSYANAKGLKQKLNGQKIELSIDQVPNVFVLNDRGHIIWLVYAYGWDEVTFRPDVKDMVVSYKITKDNVVTKNGVITVPNTDKILYLKFLQSLKKAGNLYLDQYNESIKVMSKKVVDQLIAEVQPVA